MPLCKDQFRLASFNLSSLFVLLMANWNYTICLDWPCTIIRYKRMYIILKFHYNSISRNLPLFWWVIWLSTTFSKFPPIIMVVVQWAQNRLTPEKGRTIGHHVAVGAIWDDAQMRYRVFHQKIPIYKIGEKRFPISILKHGVISISIYIGIWY